MTSVMLHFELSIQQRILKKISWFLLKTAQFVQLNIGITLRNEKQISILK